MEVKLDFPPGLKQRTFLDHLSLMLPSRMSPMFGSTLYLPNGVIESTRSGPFRLDGGHFVPLVWTLVYLPDRTLQMIRVVGDDGAPPDEQWEPTVAQFATSVLSAAYNDKSEQSFRTVLYYYVGQNLDGEYWLPGFRLAPTLPDDDKSSDPFIERVVSILLT